MAHDDSSSRPIVVRPVDRRELAAIAAWLTSEPAVARATTILCRVDRLGPNDACTVDALARLALVAQRRGWTLRVSAASPDLVAVIELMGLTAVLLDDAAPDAA